MAGCVIKKCGCTSNPPGISQYQDQKYGQGNRVMNVDLKKTEATCTVCGKTHKV
jgi:hypothetical protein